MQKVSIFPYLYNQNSQKMGRKRHFMLNTQNVQTFLLSKRLMLFQRNMHNARDHQILVVSRPKICPTNPKWRTAAILKKRINYYISATVPPISTKFCVLTYWSSKPYMLFKNQIFKNPRWTTAILKIIKCDISAIILSILVTIDQKFKNLKIHDGRWQPS